MIYFLSYSPQQSVQWLCDQHIKDCKSVCYETEWFKWAAESRVNLEWIRDYIQAIKDEHIYRFRTPHKCDEIEDFVSGIKDLNYMTPVVCDIIPESCRGIDTPTTFRNWYSLIVPLTFEYTNRKAPYWLKKEVASIAA